LAAGEVVWWQRGRATKAAVAAVDCSYFFIIKTLIFWIVGVVGGYAKKYPTRKAHICRELVLLIWAKRIAQTPNYGFVGKITARPSSLKTRYYSHNKGIGQKKCPICL
jgi:hypothetical protein